MSDEDARIGDGDPIVKISNFCRRIARPAVTMYFLSQKHWGAKILARIAKSGCVSLHGSDAVSKVETREVVFDGEIVAPSFPRLQDWQGPLALLARLTEEPRGWLLEPKPRRLSGVGVSAPARADLA